MFFLRAWLKWRKPGSTLVGGGHAVFGPSVPPLELVPEL